MKIWTDFSENIGMTEATEIPTNSEQFRFFNKIVPDIVEAIGSMADENFSISNIEDNYDEAMITRRRMIGKLTFETYFPNKQTFIQRHFVCILLSRR